MFGKGYWDIKIKIKLSDERGIFGLKGKTDVIYWILYFRYFGLDFSIAQYFQKIHGKIIGYKSC